MMWDVREMILGQNVCYCALLWAKMTFNIWIIKMTNNGENLCTYNLKIMVRNFKTKWILKYFLKTLGKLFWTRLFGWYMVGSETLKFFIVYNFIPNIKNRAYFHKTYFFYDNDVKCLYEVS